MLVLPPLYLSFSSNILMDLNFQFNFEDTTVGNSCVDHSILAMSRGYSLTLGRWNGLGRTIPGYNQLHFYNRSCLNCIVIDRINVTLCLSHLIRDLGSIAKGGGTWFDGSSWRIWDKRQRLRKWLFRKALDICSFLSLSSKASVNSIL